MLNRSPNHNSDINDQLSLAEAAAGGDAASRREVNQIVASIIDYNTNRFCKRFCQENQYLYRCTLKPPMGRPSADMAWCEWGNASYTWMLDDLTRAQRLRSYQGKNGARLFDYFYRIANSHPFYERWKDWRFGRRIHVPDYIRSLSADAASVFLALRSGENAEFIAQKIQQPITQVRQLIHAIVHSLASRQRLYLLEQPAHVSLHRDDQDNTPDIEPASQDPDAESQLLQLQQHSQIKQAWSRLSPVEQFVLEAMLIEDQQAEDVLAALIRLDISIKSGTPASETSRQQLYYFRRKALDTLTQYLEDEKHV